MDLLGKHLNALARGEEIHLPRYNFVTRVQSGPIGRPMRLGKDEVVVCEGIHALNDDDRRLLSGCVPAVYQRALRRRRRSTGNEVFKGTWMRLLRRLVRDSNFRGTPAAATLDMWANVRRGEKRFISPFKERANLMFDSSFPCEVSIMKNFAAPLLAAVPEGAERYAEIRSILPALERFETIDPALLAPESMLREFIGGGVYSY